MICNRHGCIASHAENGWLLCIRCFREALDYAADRLLEEKLAGIYRADALRARLGWRG